MEGLPHKVQLHQKYQDKGLTVITLNMEGEGDDGRSGEALLRQHQIGLVNLLLREGMMESAEEAVDSPGVLPAVNIYDRQGQLRHQLTGLIDSAEVERFVLELLDEPN